MALLNPDEVRRVQGALGLYAPVRQRVGDILPRQRSAQLREEAAREHKGNPLPFPQANLASAIATRPPRQGEMVQLDILVATVSVYEVASRQLRGPAFIRRLYMADDQETAGLVVQHNYRRLDISRNNILQDFTFNASGRPTGGRPDDLTLFGSVSTMAASGTETGLSDGWWRRSPSAAAAEQVLVFDPLLWVPFEAFWLKFYVQNAEAAAVRSMLMLTVEYINEDLPAVMGEELPWGDHVPMIMSSGE